ncbi:hypothetical protein [Candidatus Cytomitobacter primus]|uniref:Uncharacterized protein n=1 Tax=Candidatus Cytomitobacter primus TaxID=2066024 RepID=A0A5C0UGT2_9PROT|nr:hypothetical protein [Candidatus Cytomitobacter primus]QEK38502.1 hypothetical protein FZC34_01090 [Candidatus Cytomitobacter primus]
MKKIICMFVSLFAFSSIDAKLNHGEKAHLVNIQNKINNKHKKLRKLVVHKNELENNMRGISDLLELTKIKQQIIVLKQEIDVLENKQTTIIDHSYNRDYNRKRRFRFLQKKSHILPSLTSLD